MKTFKCYFELKWISNMSRVIQHDLVFSKRKKKMPSESQTTYQFKYLLRAKKGKHLTIFAILTRDMIAGTKYLSRLIQICSWPKTVFTTTRIENDWHVYTWKLINDRHRFTMLAYAMSILPLVIVAVEPSFKCVLLHYAVFLSFMDDVPLLCLPAAGETCVWYPLLRFSPFDGTKKLFVLKEELLRRVQYNIYSSRSGS